MKRTILSLLSCSVLAVATAASAGPPAATRPTTEQAKPSTTIYLLTMGSGDDLYLRAGHAALEVRTVDGAGKQHSLVYNYGDADWQDPQLASKFFRGTLRFRLSVAGTLEQVLAAYGRTQDRDVWRQRLALSAAQAQRVARRLAREVQPDRREYPYHHIERICTTRIRDLLDEVTGGALRAQLATPHPHTVRFYQPRGFRGYHLAFLGGDVLIGRLHDRPITDHYALYIPELLRSALPRVQVPAPAGGSGRVPLAGSPERLYSRWNPPAVTQQEGHTTLVVFGALSLLVLLLTLGSLLRPADTSRLGGLALLCWALPAGLSGLLISALMIFSSVPELRQNELLLSLWPADLLLLGVAVRWLRGGAFAGGVLRGYVFLHLALFAFVLIGQLVGLLYQRPLILLVFAGVGQLALWLLVRRLPLRRPRVTTT